jgi:hypothetical protein
MTFLAPGNSARHACNMRAPPGERLVFDADVHDLSHRDTTCPDTIMSSEEIDRQHQLREFIESDISTVSRCTVIANSPDRSPEERRDALAAIKGHTLRAMMLERQIDQLIADEASVRQTSAGRNARSDRKVQRDTIIDQFLRANLTMQVKRLADTINTELKKHDGLRRVSDDYIAKRRRKIGKIGSTVQST